MKFSKIDYAAWERREIYEFFQGTTMYVTIQMDISAFLPRLKENKIRFYPALIYCIAKVINQNTEYKYAFNEDKEVGIWDILHPMYTLPRKNNPQLFSMAVTEFNEDFNLFYKNFLTDYAAAEVCGRLKYNCDDYTNTMGITALTDLHFSSFTFGSEIKPDFTPFVILGKYKEENGKVILSVTGEFAHSVNDGFHISKFFKKLEEEMQLPIPKLTKM